MNEKIVVLSGSPRKNGNTGGLTAAFAGSAESESKGVTSFRAADMKINGCYNSGGIGERGGFGQARTPGKRI